MYGYAAASYCVGDPPGSGCGNELPPPSWSGDWVQFVTDSSGSFHQDATYAGYSLDRCEHKKWFDWAGAGTTDGVEFTVFVGGYEHCDVGELIGPLTISIIGGQATPSPTPTPTPGTNLNNNDHKDGGNQCHPGGIGAPPMAQYSVHSMLVSLNIEDRPLRYTPPRGPAIDFIVTYNQKETQQPATFSYSNLGPKWTFNWLSYVSDDPTVQLPQMSVYVPNGGAEIYSFDQGSQSFLPHPQSHATLVKTGSATYERRLPDGSKQIFAQSDGAIWYPRRIFMTQVVDPAGNAVTIGYDASLRITTLTDALGLVTTLAYGQPGDALKITKVTDPFGRFATFQYSSGQLTIITDEIGIQSQFTYASGTDSVDSLTTPYGTTNFSSGEDGTNRWIEMTDPLGGKERVEYRDNAPNIPASDPVAPDIPGIVNSGLDVANTFYWDKKAMEEAPGDYTKAKITHWLYSADGTISGIASSEKAALENRVWYTYAGQPDPTHVGPSANPSKVARVLGDGSTQLSQFEYNTIGKTTKATDSVGRVISSIYDTNNVDLLEVRQTTGTNNDLLRSYTYNTLHEPLTETDAAGQTTVFSYNPFGQMLTRQNARNETTTFSYGGTVPDGYLATITSPLFNGNSAVATFAYDSLNRVRTVTDSDGYAVTTDYDSLDRKTKITYPDATFEQFQYTDNVTGAMTLDLTGTGIGAASGPIATTTPTGKWIRSRIRPTGPRNTAGATAARLNPSPTRKTRSQPSIGTSRAGSTRKCSMTAPRSITATRANRRRTLPAPQTG